jgi:hypothetical protein
MRVDVQLVCDSMLGRLARFLRLLGADTLYRRDWRDAELTSLAHRERRLLLTRDTRLAQRRDAPPHLLLASNDAFGQLVEVCRALGISPGAACFTRCLACNAELTESTPQAERDRLFPFVRETRDRILACKGCRKLYWEGTHLKKMREMLGELERALGHSSPPPQSPPPQSPPPQSPPPQSPPPES